MMFEYMAEWWVLSIALALLSLLIFWDVLSRSAKGRVWRVLANVLIISSLLGLYVRPYLRSDAEQVKAALVTDSLFSINTDSLRKNGYTIIESFGAYLELKATREIEKLVVLGDGLETWELEQVVHPLEYLKPIQQAEGPLEVSANEAMTNTRSSLSFRIAANDSMNVSLSGAGIETSKQSIDAGNEVVTFEIKPTIAGNLAFELTGVRGEDTLFTELVPMRVIERSGFNTLILTSAPSFEIRFLKNLLRAQGYGVTERLQVSKETFHESFTNLDSRSLSRLSKSLLKDFKVIMLDKKSYDELSYSEQQNVNTMLKKGALGIIWMDEVSNIWLRIRPTQTQIVSLKASQQTVELEKMISSFGNDQEITFQGNTIGHLHEVGLGNVMLPLVNATYQLQLKGHDALYSDLWNALLQPIVGIELKDADIQTPGFSRVDEPTEFTFRSRDEKPIYLGTSRLAIKEKWHQPGVFTATAWPTTKGWNRISMGEKQYDFFVFGPEDWRAQKVKQKREMTAAFVSVNDTNETQLVKIQKPLSKWIFFSVLVLAFGFLWLEGRLS